MVIKKVVIVYKENVGKSHVRAHQTHYASLRYVENVLKREKISYKKVPRGAYFDEKKFDLILSVGGDGTFLDAARHARKKMVLGLNSDAKHSVGRFCAAYASGFPKALDRLRRGRYKIKTLQRMQVHWKGKTIEPPVLNDVLVCHSSPAAMNHTILKLGSQTERQRSSGVWICTAAGSSAAMQSAGGKKLPFESKNFEYRPRELFEGHGVRYKLRGGVFDPSKNLTIVSQMDEGIIFMDGPHHHLRFQYGDVLRVALSKHPLQAVAF